MLVNQKISKLYFAVAYFYIWFKDLWKGSDRKRLLNAKYRVKNEGAFLPMDTFGNVIVMNVWSRSGGLTNEWESERDVNRFIPQKIDGRFMRWDN